MEIYQLRAFVTVAKIGQLTRAAEALHVTQPAVTGQIKALEEELGVSLFDRRPGRVALTRAGERLLPEAEKVLAAAGSLIGRARELQGEVAGSLVIGTLGDPDALRLGSLLGGLVAALPLLDIKTRSGDAQTLREGVATSTLQAAFYIGPHIPRDVLGLPLQTLHYRVVAPVAYRDRLLHAGWREIADLPWIGTPHAGHVQTLLRDLFSRQGLLPNQVVESDDASAPYSLVRAGLGLALLREDMAVPAAEREELVIWPHTRVAALLSFIYPKTAEHDPAIVAALSVLRQVWGLPSRQPA
ncbi:MAG: LysR family transcriptional regulator [Hydrogenophaga sp.]|jgi:DNA-binding transcriptional LysR family regulator|uniref:LysR family transcriptional regulator n=1 Tax=Hydrogenophaga sp. TaxID=1904254 RepID=UPI002631B888|nr:LysR family transcriptional regulator [Hydrogenophaga sp.]MCW5670247.1 LysR family transcriptional regulator [Hydrogenophaga sp.]